MTSTRTITAIIMAGIAMFLSASDAAAATSLDSASSAPSCAFTSSVSKLERPDLESWLDGFLPYALKRSDIAGAVVAVVKDGEVLLQKGYGYADVAQKIPMDSQKSIVGVGSVSKTFTWTAVMQLVEQGKLDLDRDVNQYLDFKVPDAFGAPITLRQLMTHTAGFEDRLKQYVTAGMAGRPLAAHLKTVPAPTRIYAPGTVQAYSNYGTEVAGYIVERVSGELFPAYIERHILKPLHMERSTFRRPVPESLRADLAKNYNVASSGKPLAAHDNIEEIAGSPSGDLLSTADDMSKFMLAHLQNGRYADYALLRPETVRQMHAVSFVSIPGASGTALGYFRGDYNGHAVIFHAGDLSGFHTDMRLLPDDGVGLFISVNSDGAGGLLGPSYTLRAVLSQQFMDRYFPAGASLPERTTASAIEHSRIAAGEYEMSRHPSGDFMDALYLSARLTITANEDGTIETPGLISFDTGRAKKWREVGPFVWREMGGCARLNMRVEDGRVTAWLPSNLATFEVLPVPFWRSASLNVPMLLGAVFVLCATAVVWSAAALVRRRFGRDLEIVGRDALARRTAQLAVATALLFLLGYVLLIVTIAGNPSLLDVGLDPWIRLVQGIGLLSVVAAPGALWHAWSACRGRQSWWVKVSSIIVALAIVELVWFSFAFHLISAGLNY